MILLNISGKIVQCTLFEITLRKDQILKAHSHGLCKVDRMRIQSGSSAFT